MSAAWLNHSQQHYDTAGFWRIEFEAADSFLNYTFYIPAAQKMEYKFSSSSKQREGCLNQQGKLRGELRISFHGAAKVNKCHHYI